MTTSRSEATRGRRGRAAALEMAAEARRLVRWYRLIAEDHANAIQARITSTLRDRSPAVKAEIRELERGRARAWLLADVHLRHAERYERYAGLTLRGPAIATIEGPGVYALGAPA